MCPRRVPAQRSRRSDISWELRSWRTAPPFQGSLADEWSVTSFNFSHPLYQPASLVATPRHTLDERYHSDSCECPALPACRDDPARAFRPTAAWQAALRHSAHHTGRVETTHNVYSGFLTGQWTACHVARAPALLERVELPRGARVTRSVADGQRRRDGPNGLIRGPPALTPSRRRCPTSVAAEPTPQCPMVRRTAPCRPRRPVRLWTPSAWVQPPTRRRPLDLASGGVCVVSSSTVRRSPARVPSAQRPHGERSYVAVPRSSRCRRGGPPWRCAGHGCQRR